MYKDITGHSTKMLTEIKFSIGYSYLHNTPYFQRNADMWKMSMKVRGNKEIKAINPKLMYVLNISWVTA